MSKKKYVIETAFENMDIQEIMQLGLDDNGRIINWTDSIEDVEELNSDYINEHYGQLQDEAYQRGLAEGKKAFDLLDAERDAEYQKGFEDGKKSTEKGCEGCKYEHVDEWSDPCCTCAKGYIDHYEPAPHSDRIEVGDEVEDSDGNKTIVTNIHGNLFDGLCSDGSVMGDLFLDDNHKTGKHYDIASILEAMRE